MFKLSIEAKQIWPRNKWKKYCLLKFDRSLDIILSFYWELMLKLDKFSTQAISVENYEVRLFRFDYTHILMYLCRVSFLTTLDIYKDYFKGRHICIEWSSALFSLKEVTASLRQGFCNQGASWSSLLMKWRTLQPISSSSWWS